MFNIENRRYVGNKFKLMPWINEQIVANCSNCHSFFDVFAGSGSVTSSLLNYFDEFYINDFLFSNEFIYKAFFLPAYYNIDLLNNICEKYNNLKANSLDENYVSLMFGNKYFSNDDAKRIGYIREDIEQQKKIGSFNGKEYEILIASLFYSLDRIANTVGHYDAYIKKSVVSNRFKFELIHPLDPSNKRIFIYREDSNKLAKKINCDIAFIDPPYNSRQYSRFYHVLENIAKWKKPELYGTAMKPKEENMSDYCRTKAPVVFEDLVKLMNAKYLVVTYNNTYASKSTSSQNKITLNEIKCILEKKGKTAIYEKPYKFFNAGKTEFDDHKEYLFITKVGE